jgi:hypothetical protein
LQDPPKFTQIGIFGLKTNHLASLLRAIVAAFFATIFWVTHVAKHFGRRMAPALKKLKMETSKNQVSAYSFSHSKRSKKKSPQHRQWHIMFIHNCIVHKVNQEPILHFRVARWFIFKTKIPIWVNFRGP